MQGFDVQYKRVVPVTQLWQRLALSSAPLCMFSYGLHQDICSQTLLNSAIISVPSCGDVCNFVTGAPIVDLWGTGTNLSQGKF